MSTKVEELGSECSLNMNIFENPSEHRDTKKEFSIIFTLLLKGQTNTLWNLTEKKPQSHPILPTDTCPFRYPQVRGALAEEHRVAHTGTAHVFSCQHGRSKARKIFFSFPANASGLLARASSPLPGLPRNIYITKFKIIVLIQTQFLWEHSALCFTGLLYTLLLIEPFALMPQIQHFWSNQPPPFHMISVQKYWFQNMSNQLNTTVSKQCYTWRLRHAILPLTHIRIPKISVAFQLDRQP